MVLAVGLVAGAAKVAAVDLTGDNLELNGADALFDVSRDILAACPAALSDGVSYFGGGSGLGALQMAQNNQQVSPMSRPLKSGEYCGVSVVSDGQGTQLPIQQTTQSLMIGLDAISVVANSSSACTNAVAFQGSFSVTDTSGNPVVNCPGCDASTNTYRIHDSIDVLRLVFGVFITTGPSTATGLCGGPWSSNGRTSSRPGARVVQAGSRTSGGRRTSPGRPTRS
jgi:hypothetical protein